MNSPRSPWARAYNFLKPLEAEYGQESGFKFLFGIASRKHAKRKPPTFAPKIAIPKALDKWAAKKDLRAECEALCKAVVRWRDISDLRAFKPCISCGNDTMNQSLQWGHFIAQADSKWLQFDTRNTGMQCGRCNGLRQGNYPGYRDAINRREPGLAEKLEAEAAAHKNWRPKVYDLEATKKRLMAECRKAGIDPLRVLGEK